MTVTTDVTADAPGRGPASGRDSQTWSGPVVRSHAGQSPDRPVPRTVINVDNRVLIGHPGLAS